MTKNLSSHTSRSTLDEWLSYIESIHFTEIDMGLTRIKQVAESLPIDLSGTKVITVAGTNGKGTTCAFIENYLSNEKYSVAVYSSPHIETFNERLRINHVNVSDQSLIKAFEIIEKIRAEISLSYYEYTTLAALIIVSELKPDYLILEVGLGGRLDATNMVDCDVAVLTTIDLDHQAFLGDTREKIGFEKAGIMRESTYAVVGDAEPPISVLKHANTINAKLLCRDKQFSLTKNKINWSFSLNHNVYEKLNKPYIPIDNVATALTVLSLLDVTINSDKINAVIELTKVAGRTELFVKDCDVILDVGHNPQAARYLAQQLKDMNYSKVFAVVGMLADKDITNALLPLKNNVSVWYLGDLQVSRGATAQQLSEKLNLSTESVNCFDNVTQAFKMASSVASPKDLILVYGSFYTVAEIRRLLV
ncbi:bifunctional tetrahydrofolate synthase/dihydrofolate synthase [Pseudocolwellia agarivorans]|uniref:bifunctional tetrahydrofolate synthase/dihydrofolate synthase n=1 Tax=Pseudocolwellia agarivorans TaxID=1911682 RepID=UPI000985FC1A|nr:bifunctional tetrahydrofolate synthase/dihydrofolate synthase [Pseudocolwellia agarivorans]